VVVLGCGSRDQFRTPPPSSAKARFCWGSSRMPWMGLASSLRSGRRLRQHQTSIPNNPAAHRPIGAACRRRFFALDPAAKKWGRPSSVAGPRPHRRRRRRVAQRDATNATEQAASAQRRFPPAMILTWKPTWREVGPRQPRHVLVALHRDAPRPQQAFPRTHRSGDLRHPCPQGASLEFPVCR